MKLCDSTEVNVRPCKYLKQSIVVMFTKKIHYIRLLLDYAITYCNFSY